MTCKDSYLVVLYSPGYYDHRYCERVYETFEAIYSCSVDNLVKRAAQLVVETNCSDLCIFVNGVLVFGEELVDLVAPYTKATKEYKEIGDKIKREIMREATVLEERKKLAAENRALQEEMERAKKNELAERATLAKLLEKYGSV